MHQESPPALSLKKKSKCPFSFIGSSTPPPPCGNKMVQFVYFHFGSLKVSFVLHIECLDVNMEVFHTLYPLLQIYYIDTNLNGWSYGKNFPFEIHCIMDTAKWKSCLSHAINLFFFQGYMKALGVIVYEDTVRYTNSSIPLVGWSYISIKGRFFIW